MPNLLAQETSPYLLQHAHQPVDWHPWGPAALAMAREQDKPILLSIGYAACHWCHVMAHESFEDPDIAATMNRLFINIKVDREERPDLDHIYQTAHQLLTRRPGGWPLTLFLTPEGDAFFAGTYFPPEPRHGLPALGELLEQVAAVYAHRRADIARQNQSIRHALAATLPRPGQQPPRLKAEPLAAAQAELDATYDRRRGGFGDAPKFPRPTDLDFLLRRSATTGDDHARAMALTSLEKMAAGGLQDQLGGGFFRYSVDGAWTIPHFEKMLYDNAQLLACYANAWALDHRPAFKAAAEGIVAWADREMALAQGGYAASLDADSAGEEGAYYLWTPEAAQAALSPEQWALAAPAWGLDRVPNFEGQAWHLQQVRSPEALADDLGLAPTAVRTGLQEARAALLAAREPRPRPARDHKLLTGWNALMIKGLARTGRIFGRPEWIDRALATVDFLQNHLWQEGRLLAVRAGGQSRLTAYLDDYALLLDALLECLQARWREKDLAFARQLADGLLHDFEDPAAGGFFFTAHDQETLIHRPKPAQDNALPAGNGVAAQALGRLALVTDHEPYARAARRTLDLFYPLLERQAIASGALLGALEDALTPPTLVRLIGPAAERDQWNAELGRRFLPQTLILAPKPAPESLPPSPRVNAWVCQGVKCLPPVNEWESLLGIISKPPKLH